MSSEQSLTKYLVPIKDTTSSSTEIVNLRSFNNLNKQEKAQVMGHILDNFAIGAFKGIIAGGIAYAFFGGAVGYYTAGFIFGKSYLNTKLEFNSKYRIV